MSNRPLRLPPFLAAAALAAWLLPPHAARATAAGAKPTAEVASMSQAVHQGAEIFATDKFGGVRTCATCHSNGGRTEGTLPGGGHIPSLMGVAALFPKFVPQKHRVITLEQQLAHCIQGGLQGKPPASDSPEMVDLIAYLTSLSKGAVMGTQFK